MIADIQPPDPELRTAIIKKKGGSGQSTLPDDVLSFLAENLRSNIRQIEGAIKKLGAMSFLSGQQINMNVARSCISDLLDGAEPVNVTVDKVFSAVYHRYNIKREDPVSARRTKEIASARHVTVYLIRTITEMSLPNIGKLFNRDHSTILSSRMLWKSARRRMISSALSWRKWKKRSAGRVRCRSDGRRFALFPDGTCYPCPPTALVRPAPGERTISNAEVPLPGPPSPWLPALSIKKTDSFAFTVK